MNDKRNKLLLRILSEPNKKQAKNDLFLYYLELSNISSEWIKLVEFI